MTRVAERRRAFQLRQEGKSYSQIKREIRVSKSTLSLWLRNYPLSKQQIDQLRGRNLKRIEKFRHTMQQKRQVRLENYYEEERIKWLPLTHKEVFIAGLFLYWGEGSKSLVGPISLNNTDPKVLKFILYWLTEVLLIPRDKVKVYLHLYKDMDVNQKLIYWSEALNIPITQFAHPYIKESRKSSLDHKGFGQGTCGLVVNDVRRKESIMMALKALADFYSQK